MLLGLLANLILGQPAACSSFTARPDPVARAAEAADVQAVSRHRTTSKDITFVMHDGAWRLIWAQPADSERGIFFFRRRGARSDYVAVWGGVASEDERAQVAHWALRHSVPPALADCFAARVVSDF